MIEPKGEASGEARAPNLLSAPLKGRAPTKTPAGIRKKKYLPSGGAGAEGFRRGKGITDLGRFSPCPA